jgi:hypothetical protein
MTDDTFHRSLNYRITHKPVATAGLNVCTFLASCNDILRTRERSCPDVTLVTGTLRHSTTVIVPPSATIPVEDIMNGIIEACRSSSESADALRSRPHACSQM